MTIEVRLTGIARLGGTVADRRELPISDPLLFIMGTLRVVTRASTDLGVVQPGRNAPAAPRGDQIHPTAPQPRSAGHALFVTPTAPLFGTVHVRREGL